MLTGIVSHAQEVSEEQAREAAANFIAAKAYSGSSWKAPAQNTRLQLAWAPTIKSDAPEIYVFNLPNDGGFVIVSGDEATSREILGWSDNGSFDPDNIPPALRYLSAQYVAEIAALREEGSATGGARANARRAPASGYGEVKPLLKTQWNQGSGYNDLLPDYPTGCVATAMTQIMNYHQWPKHGYGKHTNMYLADNGIDQTVDFTQSVYDWEGMANNDPTAISKLMYDFGCAVNMQYKPYESSANEIDALKALITNFGYDERSIQTSGKHAETLRDELRAGRPVFYCGQDTITQIVWIDSSHWVKKTLSDSHAMVCDGFSDDGLFHFNIGWGGKGDGYYTLDCIRPNGDDDLTNSFAPIGFLIYGIKPGEKTCIDGVWYDLDDDTGSAIIGSGAYEGEVVIPEQVACNGKTYTVNAMHPYAFKNRIKDNNVITNLTFNAAIEEFPARLVMYGEDMLGVVENVSFGGGVRRIADRAFYNMKELKSVTIGDQVETIGKEAFNGCTMLQDLALGKSITEIPDYAFNGCSIKDLDVPEHIKRIGKNGISGDFGRIKFNGPIELDTLAIWSRVDISSIEGLEHCTRIAYHGITGMTGIFTPNPNASYDHSALYGKFDKVIIPAECTSYDYSTALETKEFCVDPANPNYASSGGALYTKDMKTLLALPLLQEDGTFNNFDRYVPMGVEEITDQPVGMNYTYLYLPPSLRVINASKLGMYNLRHVYSMASVPPVFDGDNQGEIQLNAELHVPVGCEEVYAAAPVWGKMPKIIGDMYVDDQYIYKTEKGYDGTYVSVIGRKAEAFTGNDFVVPSLVVIDGEKHPVTSIEPSVFQGDHAVESVTLGSFIEYVPAYAFRNCEYLKRVKLDGDIYAFYNSAFENCKSLEKVEIPRNNHLTDMGDRVFYGCSSLKSIDLTSQEDYFMNFGNSAFEGCTSLNSVKGLSNVHTLPARTFANSGIETFYIGSEMYSFKDLYNDDSANPFGGCQNLHSFTISPDNSYFYAADGVLYHNHEWAQYPWSVIVCPPLQLKDGEVTERAVVNISERCDLLSSKFPANIKEVIIPATVKRIDYGVFSLASGIEKVTVLREDPNFVSGDLFNSLVYDRAILQVPKGAKEAYAAHYEWKRFASIVEVDPEDYPSPEAIKAQQEAEANIPDDPTVGNALEIIMQDETTHFIRLAQLPVITISNNRELNINCQDMSLSLPISDIKYYRFDKYGLSEIESVGDSDIELDFADGDLNARGLKDGQTIMLYDLQGHLIKHATADSDGAVNLALRDLPTAVYVLKVNETSYKILKK